MERVMGIEPTLVAWEATVLPLNYTRAGRQWYMPVRGWTNPSVLIQEPTSRRSSEFFNTVGGGLDMSRRDECAAGRLKSPINHGNRSERARRMPRKRPGIRLIFREFLQ